MSEETRKTDAREKKKEGSKAAAVAAGILLGAAAGVAIGLLAAPKSGKDTRADLKEKAEKAAESTYKKVRIIGNALLETAVLIKDELKAHSKKDENPLEEFVVSHSEASVSFSDIPEKAGEIPEADDEAILE